MAAARRTIVERRNYPQLKWDNSFNANSNCDFKKETSEYLSDKFKSKNKDFTTNWKFNVYKNKKLKHIPNLRGHSLCDIGDSIIFIGDRKRTSIIDVYKMNKYLNKFEKLSTIGTSPCCRFHHSANYIPFINSILFFGGFDSQCNFNDTWLLSLENLCWYELIYNTQIEYRAYHSSTSRIVGNKFEIYIFGGQFCNGGPYEYHNDIFKFTFHNGNYIRNDDEKEDNEMKLGYFECEPLQTYGNKFPCERSMSYSWIKDNIYYIFGGSVENQTLNDLWTLDLHTNIWTEIKYEGILRAPEIELIQPKDFRVPAKVKPCYFDEKLNELIVIHYGKLTAIQKQFIEYDDTLCEFEHRSNENEMKEMIEIGIVGALSESMRCTVFRFDLRERKWYIERNMNVSENEKKDLPSKEIASTRIVRIGEYLIQMGGGYKKSKINYMKDLYVLKIPNYKIKNTMSWSRERLLWIAHHKGHKNENVSIFNRFPKDITLLIIAFLNPKSFM